MLKPTIPTAVLLAAFLLQAADRPIPAGATPVNHGAMGAGESPVWHPDKGLFFSGGGRTTRRDSGGRNHVYREKSGTNGLLFDGQGRLVACESGTRRVTRTEPDGTITVLADLYEGRQFNSPNDLSIDSKGRIYFTDPRYGNRDTMVMKDQEGKLVEGVYRIDAPGKVTRIITHEVDRPNGILVSPGSEFLYVADNNNNKIGAQRQLVRFRLLPNGAIESKSKRVIFDWGAGRGPDGLEIDQQGRLYVAGGLNKPNLPFETADKFKGGIYILSPKGKLLDFIPIPVDEVTNCGFGGPDWKILFITAGGTLWSIPVSIAGYHRF